MAFPAIKKTVMVTGCSSGIGAATAHVLRKAGWTVTPTARKAVDLERLRAEGFDPVELDVADSASVQAAAAIVLERGPLGAVVNNAGFGQPGALEDLSREALRYQFEVNVFGLQELTNALIPHFRERGAGRIVHVSSVLGRVSTPFVGAYCASKFAVEALADAQRVELANTGIAVSLIEPGPIESKFRLTAVEHSEQVDFDESRFGESMRREAERRRKKNGRSGNRFTLPPEAVGEKILHAVESRRPKRRYCVTVPAYLGAWLRRLAPYSLTDRILAKQVMKKAGD